jgi:ABC-type branched-subunit amino acid transport system substrate-binding protein
MSAAIVMLAAACGNSGSSGKSDSTIPQNNGATPTTFGDLTKNVPSSEQGVTDSEIKVNAVITESNSPVGSYGPFADGIKAYFKMINDGGGIYGRKLTLTKVYDDLLGQNAQAVTKALADKTFATFGAATLFTGATLLARANQPTFIWNINPEMAGKNNIFGNTGAICFKCPSHFQPFIAKQLNATKIGIIAYGVSQESKDCAAGARNSFTKYLPTSKVVFFDDSLPFAANLSSDVSQMKAKGVQYIATCIDFNESFALGKEMQRQGLKAVQQLPNAYDPAFMAQNASVMQDSIVSVLFAADEDQPQIDEIKKFHEWTDKIGVQAKELTRFGWIDADQFVTGLKLAGPEFTQQKVIDGLNGLTAYTDNGFNPPIDWTKQHNDPLKDPTALSKLDCSNYVKVDQGKFVAVYDQTGKQFTCFNRSDPNVDNPQYTTFVPGS